MAATLLDLHVTASRGHIVVKVGGKIDVESAPELRDCLYQAIDVGSRRLVVDLRRVSFIDSEGLGVLVGAKRRLWGQGPGDGSIRLVCAEGLVLRVLRVTGLDWVFPVHAALTDALGGDAGQAEDRSGQGEEHTGTSHPAEQTPFKPTTSGLDQTAIQRALQVVCEEAGWPYAEAWSPSPDGTCQLLPAWYAGDSGLDAFRRPTEALHFMPRVGLPSRVLRSRRVMFVAEVTTDPLFCRRTAARKAGLVGAIGVPVLAGEIVAAVLVFFGRAIEVPAWPKLAELAQLAASRLGALPLRS